jgi:hypothetical protein
MNRPFTRNDLLELRAILEQEVGIRIVEKSESRFMKLLSYFLFFNKAFMTGYITTVGKTVYWPDMENKFGDDPPGDAATLVHECQHAVDGRSLPVLYDLAYINPQISSLLAILSLLSIWLSPYWFIAVLFLLLLTPLPSYGRMIIETRANGAGMAFGIWYRGNVSDRWRDSRLLMYTGPGYYFMWPFRNDVLRRLAKLESNIRSGKLTKVQLLLYEFMRGRGLVVGDG